MKASEAKLQAILNSPNCYIVPVFQRYYSWGRDNWEQLWGDITELLENSQDNPAATHFLGTLVFVPESMQPDKAPTYQIIDGQQRMITLTLLLAALRNVASQYGFHELASEIQNTFLIHQYKKGVERFRVYPRHRDRLDYERIITRESEPENHVAEALNYFTRQLLADSTLSDEKALRSFFSLLTSSIEFVHITLSQENPYRIFKSLNSTGVDLSEGDLIRNFVFMHVPLAEQDEFDERHWKPLEKHFETAEGQVDGRALSAFFRDFLMHRGQYIPPAQTYQSFEARYSTVAFDPLALAQELRRFAGYYDQVRLVTPHPSPLVHAALVKLAELETSTTYPLLLNLIARDLPPEQLAQAIEWLASFILRRFVCQETSRAYARWFVAACRELDEQPLDQLRMFLIAKGFPADARFISQFVTFNLYGSRYTRAILARLERAQAHKEPADLSNAQVEHILPQTLNTAWQADLGPEAAEIQAQWLHTLGNLTLSAYNPELSNSAFGVKKLAYAQSNIVITKALAQHKTWTQAEIQARGRRLAEQAASLWAAPEDVTPVVAAQPEDVPAEVTEHSELQLVLNMLRRIGMPRGQKELYRILAEAGDEGISWEELCQQMGRSKGQMSGVLGALGRRINGTPGLDDDRGIGHVVEIWNVGPTWRYRMKPVLRTALEIYGFLEPAVEDEGPGTD
ncbi:MAG: DUF262 domain-containing protein [Anaerolineales bacterium]|nr:DUF262 domain-containing protein [Anaerolineales bacterium]